MINTVDTFILEKGTITRHINLITMEWRGKKLECVYSAEDGVKNATIVDGNGHIMILHHEDREEIRKELEERGI